MKRVLLSWGGILSLADLLRLEELEYRPIRPENRALLEWLEKQRKESDPADAEWWRTFEQELKDDPVVLGRNE